MSQHKEEDWVEAFEGVRQRLLGIAYRILGSYAEAQDVVQDTFLAWMNVDRAAVKSPTAWLVTACTRKAIDALRSARISRVDYVGAWLPEPIESRYIADAGEDDDLAETATLAFLVVLETLAPKERAAYVLRDVFGLSFAEVADSIGVSETACRKLVSRARSNIQKPARSRRTSPEEQEAVVNAFEEAIRTGDAGALKHVLAKDARLSADSGGKAVAILQPIDGRTNVARFIQEVLSPAWCSGALVRQDLNGQKSLVLVEGGAATASIAFGYDADGNAREVYITRNPEKLTRVTSSARPPVTP